MENAFNVMVRLIALLLIAWMYFWAAKAWHKYWSDREKK